MGYKMEEIKNLIKIEKFEKKMKEAGAREMRVNHERIVLYPDPEKATRYTLRNHVRDYIINYGLKNQLMIRFGEHPKKGEGIIIKYHPQGKPLDKKNYTFEKREDLEEMVQKPERPENVFDAFNSKEPKKYMPGEDFDLVISGERARKILKGMFPENTKEINKFTSKQAKYFYYNIRRKYG
jgi:hypothetical protein